MTDNLPTWARETLRRAEAATEGPWEWRFTPDGRRYGLFPKKPAKGVDILLAIEKHFPLEDNEPILAHARTDVPRLCEALAEALAALEPLAKVAASFGSAVPDGHIVNTSLHNEARIYQAKITVGDARRAAEVLRKLQKEERKI